MATPVTRVPPLDWQTPIVSPLTGMPTPQFIRIWQQSFQNNESTQGDVSGLQDQIDTLSTSKANKSVVLTAGVALSGGGDLSADRTFNLEDTAVTTGTYGDSTHSARVTIDQQGRITAASEVAIAGGSGGFYTVFDQELTVAATLVNIPSIPSGFKDLRLIIEAGRTAAGNDFCYILLNSDNTVGNYSSYVENRFGTTTHNNLMRWGSMENAGPDYAISDGWIYDYTSTTRHKHGISQGAYISSVFIDRNASVWFSTAAVTSMDVVAATSTFTAGTRIRLLAV